ncbi:MAG TPA: hypothetical protein P5044_04745 [bacterium]|nr:hypothetical protein [bacterium]
MVDKNRLMTILNKVREKLFSITFFGILCYVSVASVFWLLIYFHNKDFFGFQSHKLGVYFMRFRIEYHDSEMFEIAVLFFILSALFSKFPHRKYKYITFAMLVFLVYLIGSVTYAMMPW